jgi:hypothetical protein
MSRHDYPLTEETTKVLLGNCPAVAKEWNVSPTAVYGILEGTAPDPFAYFAVAFDACLAAGIDVSHWKARMAAIEAKYRSPGTELTHVLGKKLTEEGGTNATILEVIADGRIDEHEVPRVLRATAIERDTLDLIDNAVIQGTVTDIRDHARKAVGGNRRG